MVKNLPTVERSTKIRFGKHALENQAENTVVFNASDTPLQATNPSAVYLSPIRFRQDFSDPEIVLLMYNKTTGEITESGSSASSAIEPPLQSVTSYGNTTNRIIQFTNPTTAFTTSGNVHVNGDLEVQGNINFHNGTITEIKNTDLVVEDRIIGVAHNNTQVGLDTGIIIHYPNQNVGIIHHGDETPKRLSIGYTQQGSTDTSITADANNITLDVLGDCTVQNDLTVNGSLSVNSVSVTSVTATGTVSACDRFRYHRNFLGGSLWNHRDFHGGSLRDEFFRWHGDAHGWGVVGVRGYFDDRTSYWWSGFRWFCSYSSSWCECSR